MRRLRVLARFLAVVGVVAALGGCAAAQEQSAAADPGDPWEGLNRGIFTFNQGFDRAVLRPVAVTYRDYVPRALQDRVRDLLSYLHTPVVLANELLQGEFGRAETTLARFMVNTILGVGIADVASSFEHLPKLDEDFGQTLAVWGVDDGPYVMLPIFGPSTVRDAGGWLVDIFADPVRYIIVESDLDYLVYARSGTDTVDKRAQTIAVTDDLERSSLDYYATVRSLYRQKRVEEISNGRRAPGAEPAYPGQKPD